MKKLTADHYYDTIAKVIRHMREHCPEQPSLEELASFAGMSPFHFQRIFSEWAGISPKQFLHYTTLSFAKPLLRKPGSVSSVADHLGLSGTGRLHDLFIKIEAMTPAEYKQGGASLQIQYSRHRTLFGDILCASTSKGICFLHFLDASDAEGLHLLRNSFPHAAFQENAGPLHEQAEQVINGLGPGSGPLHLHIRGTVFQHRVWQALLQIPEGGISHYSEIATRAGSPGSARAAGTAIGSNPVAWLIPCHRVLRGDGGAGGYRWGLERKTAMLAMEQCVSKPIEMQK